MLRSIGIPARMAVGFAQGTGSSQDGFNAEVEDIIINAYTVRKNNAHAWPEVYFPGIGWVEFEPTGNQAPLDRPIAPREDTDLTGGLNPNNLPQPEPSSRWNRWTQQRSRRNGLNGLPAPLPASVIHSLCRADNLPQPPLCAECPRPGVRAHNNGTLGHRSTQVDPALGTLEFTLPH
jgi:hypothetical protein